MLKNFIVIVLISLLSFCIILPDHPKEEDQIKTPVRPQSLPIDSTIAGKWLIGNPNGNYDSLFLNFDGTLYWHIKMNPGFNEEYISTGWWGYQNGELKAGYNVHDIEEFGNIDTVYYNELTRPAFVNENGNFFWGSDHFGNYNWQKYTDIDGFPSKKAKSVVFNFSDTAIDHCDTLKITANTSYCGKKISKYLWNFNFESAKDTTSLSSLSTVYYHYEIPGTIHVAKFCAYYEDGSLATLEYFTVDDMSHSSYLGSCD